MLVILSKLATDHTFAEEVQSIVGPRKRAEGYEFKIKKARHSTVVFFDGFVGIFIIIRKPVACFVVVYIDTPYPCPFKSRCWPALPEHHISTLYKLNKDAAFDLENNSGITEDHHLVDEIKLNRLQQRQVDAVKANAAYVSKDLRAELEKIEAPVSYLDFETIMPAIPIFDGDSPYQHIPAQFSCHVENENGDLTHFEWIAIDSSDPRIGMVDKLLEACESAKTIVAYNAKFEKSCLDAIAKAVPEKADRILALKERFFDLLPLVRNHIYDPKFKGSFSIKAVLPALVPDATYDELEISNGMVASVKLEQIVTGDLNDEDKYSIIAGLLKYCALDSMAMLLLKNALERGNFSPGEHKR